MTATIQIKRSNVAGKIPGAAALEIGELAVNFADKKIYTKEPGGTIVNLTPDNPAVTVFDPTRGYSANTIVSHDGKIYAYKGAGGAKPWDAADWTEIGADVVHRVITANDANPGLRITQTGAGAALLVEDEANPDATPFIVTTDGSVGIGTATPRKNVEIKDTSPVLSVTAAPTGTAHFGGSAGTNIMDCSVNSTEASIGTANVPLVLNATTAHPLIFKTSNVQQMEIGPLGHFLIGQTYGLGRGKVIIAGSVPGTDGAYATGPGVIVLNDSGRNSVNEYGGLEFKGSVYGSGYGVKLMGTDTGNFLIGTRSNNASFTECMRVSADGGSGGSQQFRVTSQATRVWLEARQANGSTLGDLALEGDKVIFYTNAKEWFRIDAAGRGHYGESSFSVPGGSGIFQITGKPGYYATLTCKAAGTANHTQIEFCNANGTVGSVSTNGSTTTYATSSDYRLKENIQPVENASPRLLKLKPVNFAWKGAGNRVDGFIAHEVQAVVPEAVVGEKDAVDADGNPIMQGIDQSKLVPLLTAALQEALKRIEALEAKLTTPKP